MKDKVALRFWQILFSISFLICMCNVGNAQEVTGSVTGTVRDQNGAVIQNAQVKINSTERGLERTYSTNDEGTFSAPLLPPGAYTVTVSAQGFGQTVVENVQISVNDRRIINVELGVSSGTETVTVTDEASVIQESPTQQSLIEGTQVRQLPLNNRNFVQLATLSAGVTSSNSSQIGFGGLATVQISINGGRTSSINWLVDGSRNIDSGSNLTLLTVPSVDAIQEFTVLTSNYAPEFGRNGGGVINVVTRQGTNKFHGTLYEFVRNDALNVRDPFIVRPIPGLGSASDPRFKQPLRYNDFGGTIGGPVHFLNFGEGGPTVYNGRDRTYFFFSQEFRRVRSTSIPVATVATNAQRSGNFGTTTIYNPATGLPFANNTILPGQINPNTLALLDYILAPNEGTNQYRRVASVAGNFRQSIIRFDHNFTPNTIFTARYIQDNFERDDPGGNPFQDPFVLTNASGTLFPNVASQQTSTPGKNFVASLKFGLSPTVINEIAFDYAYNLIQSSFVGTGLRANTPGFTVPERFPSNLQGALPSVTISGISGLAFTSPQNIENPSYTVRDNLTWVAGNHTLKFGAFLSKEAKNENAGNPLNGTYTFDGTRTGNPAVPGSIGSPFADFLLGLPRTYTEAQNEIRVELRYNTYEFYAQDSWKVTPRLAIDFGARYSIFENPIELNNYLATFLPEFYDRTRQVTLTANGNNINAGSGDRFNGLVFAGENSPYGDRVQSNQYNTIAPRIGFAYNVFGDGKTVVRGGFGLYYDRTLVGIVEQNAFLNPKVAQTVTIDNPVTLDPNTGSQNNAIPVVALTTTGDEFKSPQTLQYNVSLQRELFKSTYIEVAYVGTTAHNLLRQVNINQPLPRFARNGGALARNFYRPFIGYGNINERRTDADSNYNSAQLTLTRRFSQGLQFGAVYTFSKNITESSTDRSDTIQNPLRPELERAVSQFDRTHVFTVNFLYELPFGKGKSFDMGSVGNAIFGGFQLAGIYSLQSGTPLTITQTAGSVLVNGSAVTISGDPLDTGTTIRPNLICDPTLSGSERTTARWFNTSCFSPVLTTSAAYGNAGRGIVRGPGINNLDISLYKAFRFTESINLQLRAEFFNALNHTQYNNPVTTYGSANFGSITSARDPRIIQFGAKFNF